MSESSASGSERPPHAAQSGSSSWPFTSRVHTDAMKLGIVSFLTDVLTDLSSEMIFSVSAVASTIPR